MNRTEHRIRLAFDSEYEAKWREVEEYRASVRKETFKLLRSKSVMVLSFWSGLLVYIFSRSWPAAFAAPVVAWLVESGVYAWTQDRQKRKELGI